AGGLSFAIALKRRFGYQNFTTMEKIFEKTNAVGGTWHPEIRDYWDDLRKKYSLTFHINFGTTVVKAVWDSNASCYHVTTEDMKTGTKSTTNAEILVSALGILEIPRAPDIPGLSDFGGVLFHSARWIDMDLDNKHVAVIGNGASATQLLPIIAKTPNIRITQFCRTPNWLLPPSDFVYFAIFSNSITRRWVQKLVERYIKNSSPKEYLKYLVPKYDLGCRRIIFNTDYLSTLHRSNVHLDYGGIASIVEDGIVTQKGEHLHFDVIILATGFCVDNYPLHIEGKSGQTVQDYFDSKGGPTAYMGTTVPGFPNLYMLGGPNTATGHTSVIFTEEVQINYSLELIKPILDGELYTVEVKHEATDRYNDVLQKRLSRSVFVGCNSWYRVNGTGRIGTMFPGSSAQFWWWLWRPIWADYEVTVRNGSREEKTGCIGILCVALAATVAFCLAL
ncbi:hypothetical protein C0993_000159, partial [Termitomyces sp. T159_Od127]